MKTILLDLNWTLVANSDVRKSPFLRQIEAETYREDLIKALAGHHVILITARPGKYREATLHSIESKTGWHPTEAHFNGDGLPPPVCKDRILRAVILDRFAPADLLAIESNPRTRSMYATHGIAAVTRDDFLSQIAGSEARP